MKLNRSFLMGLGSGLILSALIAMVVPPVSINLAGDIPAANQGTPSGEPGHDNQSDPAGQDSSTNAKNGKDTTGDTSNPGASDNPDTTENSSPETTKLFIIPSGSTADKIADLLLAEGWISSKDTFLDLVKEKNLARRFRAGSFELTQGMKEEEILNQLIR